MSEPYKYTKDLIPALSDSQNIGLSESKKAVNFVISHLKQCILEFGHINISNFGKFSLKNRKKKETTHPITNERHCIKERQVAACKFSENWKEYVTN